MHFTTQLACAFWDTRHKRERVGVGFQESSFVSTIIWQDLVHQITPQATSLSDHCQVRALKSTPTNLIKNKEKRQAINSHPGLRYRINDRHLP